MSSPQVKLRERIVVKNYDQDGNLRSVGVLDNDSLRPTPVRDRSWTQVTYTIFWWAATANVSNLYNASTGMSAGLSMWEALACQTAIQFVAGLLMALNGRAGALYRIPFQSFAGLASAILEPCGLHSIEPACRLSGTASILSREHNVFSRSLP